MVGGVAAQDLAARILVTLGVVMVSLVTLLMTLGVVMLLFAGTRFLARSLFPHALLAASELFAAAELALAAAAELAAAASEMAAAAACERVGD
ncbi:MAG: hypothetical protein ACXWJ2_07440 [Hyphomicrobium sp.]